MTSVLTAPAPSRSGPATTVPRWSAKRMWAATSTRVYLPACSIAGVAAVLVVIGWSHHWGGTAFSQSLTSLRVVIVGPLTLAIIGVFLVTERVWPAQQRSLFARGYRHDLLLTIMNVLLVAPLVTALTLSFVDVMRRSAPWIVLPRIGTLPRWGAIALIFVAMDFCNWLAHYANHRFRMLWRFHELHHSQEDMNVLDGVPHPSVDPRLVSDRADTGRGAPRQRRLVADPARDLWRHRGVRSLEYPIGVRAAGSRLREPQLSPYPPPAGRTARRQPRLRPDDLGSALPPRRLPDRADDPDRHRIAGTAPDRGTGGGAATSLRRPCSPAGRPLPVGERPLDEPVRPLTPLPDRTSVRSEPRTTEAPESCSPRGSRTWRRLPDGDGLARDHQEAAVGPRAARGRLQHPADAAPE